MQHVDSVIKFNNLEIRTPWANRAEFYIGLLKEGFRKDMIVSNSPMCLWYYATECRAMIHNLVSHLLFQNKSLPPHDATFGETDDISNLCTFAYYEWVYHRDHGSFPENKEKIESILGPIHNEGNEMTQAVVTSKAIVCFAVQYANSFLLSFIKTQIRMRGLRLMPKPRRSFEIL